jgi:putative spermidine/putrescine transport system permease protein
MSDRTRIILLLLPALLVIGVLFFGGLLIGVMRSFNYMPVIGLTTPNLDAYRAVFADPEFYWSFLLTFHIAFTSTVISSVIRIWWAPSGFCIFSPSPAALPGWPQKWG